MPLERLKTGRRCRPCLNAFGCEATFDRIKRLRCLIRSSRAGTAVIVGGILWLVGVLILELTFDPDSDSLPVSFEILATAAGLALGWGLWRAAGTVERRVGRLGFKAVAVCSGLLGVGFAIGAVPEFFLGFFVTYAVGLFVLPVAFLVLGFGLRRSEVYPVWAKWVPFVTVGVAFTTYGFHALARNVWDPSDAVWYVTLGASWILIGQAIRTVGGALQPASSSA